MTLPSPDRAAASRLAKGRTLRTIAMAVLGLLILALSPIVVLALTYGAADAACRAARSC